MILPKHYHLSIDLNMESPSSEGGFAKIWEGNIRKRGRVGDKVCIKIFEGQIGDVLEKMKIVCDSVRPEGECSLITIRSSIVQS